MGVKSLGCENNTAQESPIQSWNLIGPSVVSASKSGAVSPIARPMASSSSWNRSDYAALSAMPAGQHAVVALAPWRHGDDQPHEDLRQEVGVRPGTRSPQPARATQRR